MKSFYDYVMGINESDTYLGSREAEKALEKQLTMITNFLKVKGLSTVKKEKTTSGTPFYRCFNDYAEVTIQYKPEGYITNINFSEYKSMKHGKSFSMYDINKTNFTYRDKLKDKTITKEELTKEFGIITEVLVMNIPKYDKLINPK